MSDEKQLLTQSAGTPDTKAQPVAIDLLAPIPLKHPFTSATGAQIDVLSIQRRAKRKDLKEASKHSANEAEQEDFMFARITGLTIEDIEQVDVADSVVLSNRFRAMLAG